MRPQLPDDDPAQYVSIIDRLTRLESRKPVSSDAFLFPTLTGLLDVTIPAGTSLVTIDFECEMPFGSSLLLRPNGDTTSILTDYSYTSSTSGPATINNPPAAAQAVAAGLMVVNSLASAGATRAVGTVVVVTRNVSGRTPMQSVATYTNTVGSGGAYIVSIRSSADYDVLDDVNRLQFALSAGVFNGGTAMARFV